MVEERRRGTATVVSAIGIGQVLGADASVCGRIPDVVRWTRNASMVQQVVVETTSAGAGSVGIGDRVRGTANFGRTSRGCTCWAGTSQQSGVKDHACWAAWQVGGREVSQRHGRSEGNECEEHESCFSHKIF